MTVATWSTRGPHRDPCSPMTPPSFTAPANRAPPRNEPKMPDWIHLTIPPAPAMFAQLLVGLINGAFYAMLSLGLAVIFGLLNIINFAHGAQYMLGAFCAWFLLNWAGIGYWPSLVIAPVVVGITGILIERFLLRRIARLDHLYGLLLTFGVALILQGLFTKLFGSP